MDPRAAVKRALSGANTLVETIAVPKGHKPLRLPTFPNLERTAVFSAISTTTLGIGSGGSTAAVLVRSPVYPLWSFGYPTYDGSNGPISSWAYVKVPPNAGYGSTIDFDGNAWFTNFGKAVISEAYHPLIGKRDGSTYIYVPQNTTPCFFLKLNAASTISEVSFTWETVSCGTTAVATSSAAPSTNSYEFELTNAIPGGTVGGYWYRPLQLMLESSTSGAFIEVCYFGYKTGGTFPDPTGTMAGPAMVPIGGSNPPEFTTFPSVYNSVRSNANAVLFQNVTSVLNKEGTVRCTRLPVTTLVAPWDPSWANQAIFLSASPIESYYGPLEKGLYTYTMADASSSVMRAADGVGGVNPMFYIDGFDYVNCMLFTDMDSSSATNLAIEIDYHFEFRTSSALFTLGFSNTSLEDYHHAQMALAKMGVFFENPLHLRDIASLARRGLQGLAPYAKIAGLATLRAGAAAGGPITSRVADLALTALKMAGNMRQSNPGTVQKSSPPHKQKKKIQPKAKKRR